MRFVLVAVAVTLIAAVSYVHCGCDDGARSPDDSDFSKFFKDLGCDIKKGADKISETTKPWVDKIEDSAKKLTDSVAETFSDLKGKISGSSEPSVSTESPVDTIITPAATSTIPDVVGIPKAPIDVPSTPATAAKK